MLSQLIFILILRMSSQEDGMELKDKELLKRLSTVNRIHGFETH